MKSYVGVGIVLTFVILVCGEEAHSAFNDTETEWGGEPLSVFKDISVDEGPNSTPLSDTVDFGVASEAFTRKPYNVAAKTGDQVRMQCDADLEGKGFIIWTLTKPEDRAPEFIYRGPTIEGGAFGIIPHRQDIFDGDEENLHDLIIKQSSGDVAAFSPFTCTSMIGVRQETVTAHYTNIDTPECISPNDVYEEGSTPDLTCSVTYTGVLKPTLVWRVDGKEDKGIVTVDSDDDETPPGIGELRKLTVSYNVTVKASHDDAPFQCLVKFVEEDQAGVVGGPDVKAPTYKDNCTTSFSVEYAPRDIRFSPDPDDVPDGKVMTVEVGHSIFCNVSGSPPISYRWNKEIDIVDESKGPMYVEGSELLITDAFLGRNAYSCIAGNEVRGSRIDSTPRNIEFTAIPCADSSASLMALWSSLLLTLLTWLLLH